VGSGRMFLGFVYIMDGGLGYVRGCMCYCVCINAI
jgi:hypothetical protein